MKPRHKVSLTGIELIKSFEGYRRAAAQLPDGRWTIGYGHSKTARRGVEVSEEDADLLLHYDLIEIAEGVNALTFTPLTQNQFDALVSFAFNISLEGFRRSIVLRRVNEGALLQAAGALEMWRKADFEGERIVVDALVRRRAAEKALFLTPPDGWVPAPSPVLPPRFDSDDGTDVPTKEPIDLKASLEGGTATVVRGDAAPIIEPRPEERPDNIVQLHAPAAEVAASAVAPSQISEASEALSARLEAIFTGAEEEPLVQPVAEPVLEPELAPEAVQVPFEPSPPESPAPEAQPVEPAAKSAVVDHSPLFEDVTADTAWPEAKTKAEIEAAANDDHSPFKTFRPIPIAADTFRPQPIYREEPVRDAPAFQASVKKPKARFAAAPYLILAFVGFAFFAFATSWAFRPHPRSGPIDPMIAGVIVAAFGIGCVAWSVYTLTARYNGRED